jgi:hypothetical protein
MTSLNEMTADLIGTTVVIRSNMSGVHVGTLMGVDGPAVRLHDSRRLLEWHVANRAGVSLTEVAVAGIDANNSHVSMTCPVMIVYDVCEIIPAHGLCAATVAHAPTFVPH